jgi:hypothetical protein
MPKKKKTRNEKIKSSYRLDNFALKIGEQEERKDKKEFAYLDRQYVGKDLMRTVIYSALILGLLMMAKRWVG